MLLNATNDIVKCTEPPKHVQMNAVFLIDLRYIPLDDLRADGLPQYDNYDGKRTMPVEVENDENGELKVVVTGCEREKPVPARRYYLERLYHSWNVKKKNRYHRRIMHVRDERGEVVNNVACVQYVYDKEEVKFAMKPHKSSKNGKGVPYTRTKPSVVRNLDNKLASLGPKDAVSMTTQESGGVLKAECLSDLPRGPRQGYYVTNFRKKRYLPMSEGGRSRMNCLKFF